MADRCYVASDGTRIRLSGNPTPETVDAIAAELRSLIPETCCADTGLQMPPTAQRLHGRENYICNREPGHAGLHAWYGKGADS